MAMSVTQPKQGNNMADKPYSKMTKAELVKLVDMYELNDAVAAIRDDRDKDAEVTNSDMAKALEANKERQSEVNSDVENIEDEVPAGAVLDPNGVPMIKATSKSEDMIEDNERMVAVAITDHDTSITIEGDMENRLFQASWGNMICPVRQESVLVNGNETHCSRGMLKHMKPMTVPTFFKGVDGKEKVGTKPRFSVIELEGMTETEFKAFQKQQELRKVK